MVQPQAKRKKSPLVNIKRCLWALLLMALLAFLFWFWSWAHNSNHLPIKHVEVKASYLHLQQAELKKVIAPYATGGFFTVNVAAIKKQLMQLPWVRAVSINRIWPGALVIHIEERQAVAFWGDASLLSAQGVVFSPDKSTFPEGLPAFSGPTDQQSIMLQAFSQMNAMLAPIKLSIVELSLTARHAWRLVLDNQITLLLGHADVQERLQRFIAVYPRLRKPIHSVDLRYPDGMAVH